MSTKNSTNNKHSQGNLPGPTAEAVRSAIMSAEPVMPPAQIDRWCRELDLSETATAHIHFMNTSEPVRTVNGKFSVRGKFPSIRMKRSLQFESHKCELSFIWMALYRERARLLLDQPCVITLNYEAEGRRRGFTYTPDFFILTQNGAELVECKYEAELRRLSDPSNPRAQLWRYQRTEGGSWFCPSGNEAAAQLGLKFRVFSTDDAPVTLLNNFDFLADYYDRAFREEQFA